MANVQVQMNVSGPLFDGRAEAAIDDFLDAAKSTVADVAVIELRTLGMSQYDHPTGFYVSTIHVERVMEDYVITDNAVYGDWLEGVSSRNAATRFKGYKTFRLITQRLKRDAVVIAEATIRRFISRMN